MTTLLIFVAIALVFFHGWVGQRRRGYFQPSVLMRDAGIAILALYILISGSDFIIDYAWWKELGQRATFWQYLRIRWLPETAAALVAIALLLVAVRLGKGRARGGLADTRLFRWGAWLAAILLGLFLSFTLIDPWIIALYLGSRETGAYRDPLFGKTLTFYLFRLPFYEMIFAWAAAVIVVALVLYVAAMVIGSSAERMRNWRERMLSQMQGGGAGPILVNPLSVPISFSGALRTGGVVLLILFAIAQFFGRYSLLYSQHDFLYGADFVDARWGIPFYWVQIVGALALALVVALGGRKPYRPDADEEPGYRGFDPTRRFPDVSGRSRPMRRLTLGRGGWWLPVIVTAFLVLLLVPAIIEGIVRRVFVMPNELTLERPYIEHHIAATRAAFDIEQRAHEEPFEPRSPTSLNLAQYPDTVHNIRLWDWQPFHDNVTQLQALRPYYVFPDVDLDRYQINGQMRQVLIAGRSLDTDLLPESAQTWVNLNLQYTHGYGAVAGLVNSATEEGQPELLIKNAPPETNIPGFRITRPEIYFFERATRQQNIDQPVFVDTSQQEFDYPRGDENTYTTYRGAAGIPIGRPVTRLAAAIAQNDWNVLVTSYIKPQSRLVLHREIIDRVQRLAPFLLLDPDPYLVIDDAGRLMWMLDAYTHSDRHPYAQPLRGTLDESLNYIRNSVKITVDAYNGSVHFYVFDEDDPVLAAYRAVFPQLFTARASMPADLLRHVRYPELLFRAQAEIYTTYHMRDPQVFYNKEDLWDVAKQVVSQGQTRLTDPYYVVLQLPGEQRPEFVLLLPFTSHNRDNLIAWIAARCDPEHYGEIIFYRLPKQELIYGPLQIESRMDQDRTISKDLSLWNQQGSSVIRGNTLVLPVGNTFLYAEPIYIQATQARMPELKKVVLAIGNRLVYADDLNQAVSDLARLPEATGASESAGAASAPTPTSTPPAAAQRTATVPADVLRSIQEHMNRYRQLTAAGRLADAGRELQAIDDQLRGALPH